MRKNTENTEKPGKKINRLPEAVFMGMVGGVKEQLIVRPDLDPELLARAIWECTKLPIRFAYSAIRVAKEELKFQLDEVLVSAIKKTLADPDFDYKTDRISKVGEISVPAWLVKKIYDQEHGRKTEKKIRQRIRKEAAKPGKVDSGRRGTIGSFSRLQGQK